MTMLKISGKRFFELRRNAKRLQESYRVFIESLVKLYNQDYIIQNDKNMIISMHYNKSKEKQIIKEIEGIITLYIIGVKDTMSHYKNYYYDDVKEVSIDHVEFEYLIDELNKYENKIFSIKERYSMEYKIKFALQELEEYFDKL